MGYFTKHIAKESKKPAIVSLSSNANYIQFESLNDASTNKHVELSLQVINTAVELDLTTIVLSEKRTNVKHEFKGTRSAENVNSSTFFVSEDKAMTAENIRACLLNDDFFRAHFYLTIPTKNNKGIIENGDTIFIRSMGTGANYAFKIDSLSSAFLRLAGDSEQTTNNDSISGEAADCEIEIDIYRDTNLFLGVDDTPQNDIPLGTYLATLTKAYYTNPIWFDLNSILNDSNPIEVDLFTSADWFNTGTISDFRFIARKNDGVNRQPFYLSSVLYTIKGYDRNLAQNDLSNYVYNTLDNTIVKPLTKQPVLTHVKGQTQYFNFLLADPDRNKDLGGHEYELGIMYKLYTQSKRFVADVLAHTHNRKQFNVANTVSLDLDGAIGEYDRIGYVEVYLIRSGCPISEPLQFRILPACLHKVKDFAFLNALGGWSSFNFGGTETTDFKSTTNTIHQTQTPNHTISSQIESIYSKEITEQFTVQTMPIDLAVVNWLKELSSSEAVYELATKRYIVVDELNIKPNSKDELFRLEMKYHYTDTYNGSLK